MRALIAITLGALLSACGRHELRCDGPLQPINVAAAPHNASPAPPSGRARIP